MPVLAPVIGAAVAFVASPMGLALIGGTVLAVVGGLLLKSFNIETDTSAATVRGVEAELQIGEEVPTFAVYGRSMLAGHYIYHNEYGPDNQYMQMVFALGNGRYDSLEKIFVDGQDIPLTGSNSDFLGQVVNGKYNPSGDPHMWVKFYDGSLNQVADPGLVGNSGGRWTTAHRLAGIPYAIVTMKYHEDIYGSSLPKFGFQVKGLRLYDFRKDSTFPGGSGSHRWDDQSTWEWTDNAAICMFNYKRGLYQNGVLVLGQGATMFDIDVNRFAAAFNLCDEMVVYPDTGKTITRYTYNAIVKDSDSTQTVMRSLESSMAGYGTEIGGAYGPLPGQQQSPVLTITDLDLIEDQPVTAEVKMAPSDCFTAVSGVYLEPTSQWQQVSYGVRFDAAVESAEGGRRLAVLDLPFVNSYERANTIAEILRRRDRFQATETIAVGPEFMGLEPGDVITRVKPLWGAKQMMVLSREEGEGKISVLKLREFSNLCFPASGDSFMPLPFIPGVPISPPARLTTVIGLNATAIAMPNADGDNRAAILVQWDPITDPTVNRVIIKYWPETKTEDDAEYVNVEVRASTSRTVLTGLLGSTLYHIKASVVADPPRATVWSGEVTATTLEEDFQANVYDVDLDQLSEGVQTILSDLFGNVREVLRQAQELASMTADEILGSYDNFQQARRELSIVNTDIRASYKEDILVATGPNSAIVQRIEALEVAVEEDIATAVSLLQAQINELGEATADSLLLLDAKIDDVEANVTVRGTAGASPGGGWARWGVEVKVGSEPTWSSGAFFIDTNGTLSRAVFIVDQFIVSSGSTLSTPFYFDGSAIRVQNAFIANLTSANIQAGSITADRLSVTALSAVSANLGTVTAGTISLGAGKLLIDGPNVRILVSD